MKRLELLLTLLIAVQISPVSADISLDYLGFGKSGDNGKRQTLVIKDGRVLVKSVGGDQRLDLIYTAQPEQLFVIDHGKRRVLKIDEGMARRFERKAAVLQPLLGGLGKQIGKLNPDQRARLQEMMGGKINLDRIADAGKSTRDQKMVMTGQTLSVGGYECERAEMFQGKKKTGETCMANPEKMDFPAGDLATLRSMFNFSERLLVKAQGLGNSLGIKLPRLDFGRLGGVPLEMRQENSGQGTGLKLGGVSSATVASGLMQVPENYEKVDFAPWK